MSTTCTRFIILADARTGSTMLGQALNSHPSVRCFREIFDFMQPFVDFEMDGYDNNNRADYELRESDACRFLDERIFCAQPEGVTAVGFKFMYGHFWGYAGLLERLTSDLDLRIVHMQRRNMLRALVSLRIAEATGDWYAYPHIPLRARFKIRNVAHAIRDPLLALRALRRSLEPARDKPADLRVSLTPDECRAHFERVAHDISHWNSLFADHPLVNVVYEDFVADPGVADELQRFLDLDPSPLAVGIKRQNPEPLRQLIANYDELRASFAGTKYEAWFDD
jgi:LPS sulfotransferase NodH